MTGTSLYLLPSLTLKGSKSLREPAQRLQDAPTCRSVCVLPKVHSNKEEAFETLAPKAWRIT